MRTQLTYTFNESEQDKAEVITKATDWYFALWDLDQALRAYIKYGENAPRDFTAEDPSIQEKDREMRIQAHEEVREKLHDIMNEYGLRFCLT